MKDIDVEAIDRRLARIVPTLRKGLLEDSSSRRNGRILQVTGFLIHARIEDVRLGEVCELVDPKTGSRTKAEVVGLMDEAAVLVPLGDVIGLSGVTEVVPTGHELRIPVGAGLLGRVMSALGEPLDDEPLRFEDIEKRQSVNAYPPQPLERSVISEPMTFGIAAVDGLLTCARGQRMGVFGSPGTGKSQLLADIVHNADADVIVVALIGERGREVREFVEQIAHERRARIVTVVATSDRPAIERVKAAYVATTIAEYFRDTGQHVLLAMDSVTRFARAQREIGLAAGEPPTRRGYPPSLFAVLPRLLERAGTNSSGSITGIYSVLTEDDGMMDPVAEEIQALLDGHIWLSPELARRNHFPAVDVLRSRSRLMNTVVSEQHCKDATHIRTLLARHAEVELLLRIGEYTVGNDPLADEAIEKIGLINTFLSQPARGDQTLADTQFLLRNVIDDRP